MARTETVSKVYFETKWEDKRHDSLNLERGIDLYVGPQSSRDRMEDSTFDAHLIKPEFPIDFLPQCRVTSFEALLRNTVSHGTRSLPILAALKT